MKRVYKLYDKTTNKVTSTLTNIALDKFVKSEYLRDTTSILPLMLLTTMIRSIFNFLIISRIRTEIYLIDFCVSIIVTITLAFLSPYIYNHIAKMYDTEIKNFSQLVIDSYWIEGWTFIERWKTIILGSLGIFIILILFVIELNSYMVQEFIFHTLISSAIIDYLTQLKDRLQKNQTRISNSPLAVKVIEKPSAVLSRANSSYKNLSVLEDSPIPQLKSSKIDYVYVEDYKSKNE